ncbi:threonine--tRNA ligase [Arthrobacter sp. TES]|uniref:Threonine--tRNA ligase n=1 Tax=Paenarthrobacter ureafaciens TaxID=37931 RepID=A0AAX3ECW1_PAEUR|nr:MULTISPECIES: threonine--tRNA ligase [Paenarthrobacter]AMB40753.1 threonine--tRNA ligase [Arthrobacter sp. ATCC 21022]AOY71201.1 threonyl-tRNA synthetase [Arthrobacter sp. ZXY-2]ERI39642.1 threonine--tRNA ligase [Arthrobacter sp. AK-YN10]NKR10853.1 threonine--tRNA ligase [Arthrobacter sp. M5]NKR18447.1 threonine--tRNA ligase [Arthrobacter sp. M6]OEH57098.1 threonine--tRNA ligase [Arthrobacter sp. D2]OEH64541.1 threonine--tRNA ligase [Arthrobacter sp. D4]QOI63088.1 threonine--tRNA ligase 
MSDAQQITLIVDGEETKVTEGTTGAELFFERRDVVVARVDGVLKDLDQPLADGASVEGVTIESPDGLNVLRHSTAHVMAQAVQQLRPDAKLGIGPYITDGFYFDFDVAEPFTPEDLRQLEKMMQKIINQNQKFVRRVVTEEEARQAMANEPYKLELLGKKNDAGDSAEGVNVEVGAGDITIYDNVDRKSGDTVWCDLCRGPHLPNTKLISNAFALTRSSSAYWLGNQNNQQLQRIYGTAWPTKDALKAYQERIAEAERRDHRKLGVELDLFSFPDELGSGLPVFHPKGGIIRKAMEDYSRQRHVESGYEFVYTPHITKGHLYEVSGHLDWYKDGMFPAMQVDAELNEDGTVRKPAQDYYLKPMNCPMHNLIFRSRGRSYRELPLRLFEFGSVYRYEKSGVVHGLTRVRGMTQDDAHIYCTREQMKDELTTTLNFVLGLLKDYGLDDFYLELSTKNEEKFVGDDATWEEATRTLAEVAEASGLELVPDPGGAAFYGPKISVQAKDALGRTWQMSTIQLDFNLPERFELEYQAADGTRQRPVMIHRALFGSVERFMGVLTEHYAGAFPAWLAPVQVVGIPVAEAFNDYMFDVVDQLKAAGIRAEVDISSDRFPKKIRTASKDKIPFVLIAGGEDAEAGAVSFRFRDGSQDNGVPVAEAVRRIVDAVKNRES